MGTFFSSIGSALKGATSTVKDWAVEFGSDALECGKDFVNDQYERGQKLWNDPSIAHFADFMTYGTVSGYVKSCQQRYEQADDAYGYLNWALSGVPEMIKGAFFPEEPYSFQHVMDSIGTASLVVGAYAGAKVKTVSPLLKNEKVSKSKSSSSANESWGNIETLDDHYKRNGKDFNAINAADYAQMANDFYENRYHYMVKVDNNGTIRVYDPSTNTFGAYNSDGTSKTFFKPKSKNYFNNQPGDLIETIYDN